MYTKICVYISIDMYVHMMQVLLRELETQAAEREAALAGSKAEASRAREREREERERAARAAEANLQWLPQSTIPPS